MGSSWQTYCNYDDEVRKHNVEPTKIDALPAGSEIIGYQPRFCDAPAKVFRTPDGRVVEVASVNRGMWFVYYAFENDGDWLGYRKPLPVNLYLHG